ncbi:MAG: chemotaxis protein CheW [Xenococcaceae cyanobacterium]
MMENLNQPTLEFKPLSPKLGDAYLKLQLEEKVRSILPLGQIKEVALIQREQVTFIPGMAKCILGLVYRRNQVIWLVDLPQILNLKPIQCPREHYQVAIANHENMALGLVVQQIQEVIRLHKAEINFLTEEGDRKEDIQANDELVESQNIEQTSQQSLRGFAYAEGTVYEPRPSFYGGDSHLPMSGEEKLALAKYATESSKFNLSPKMIPFLSGWIQQSEETLMLLNTEAILNAPILHKK